MKTNLLKSLTIGIVLFTSNTAVLNAAWLKAYGPANGVNFVTMLNSPQGNFYLFGQKNSGFFAAKLDNLGHFKWGKQLLSPIRIENSSLTLTPPFIHMFRPLSSTSSATSPFIWGQVSQDDNTGAVNKVYAKTFVKQLPGILELQGYKDKGVQLPSYALVGAVNSNIRGGLNVAGGDSIIGNINTATGTFTWSHIYGFNLNGMIPLGGGIPPWLSKRGINYYFSRPLVLTDNANASLELSTVVAKLNANGAILKQIMIDGLNGSNHSILQDGSVMVYAINLQGEFTLVKLDSNLNLLWQNKYVSSAPSYQITLSSRATINELQDGTLELVGEHIVSSIPRDTHPLIVHINKLTGDIVSKKEILFGPKDSTFNLGTFPTNTGLPRAFDWLAGSTRKTSPAKGDIVYGKLNQGLSFLWLKTLPGLAPVSSPVVNPYSLFPNDNLATSYHLAGLATTTPTSTVPKMLAGFLNTNGNVPGCAAIKNITTVTTVIPPIVAQATNELVHLTMTVKNFGPIPAVKEATVPPLQIRNLPLTETVICQ